MSSIVSHQIYYAPVEILELPTNKKFVIETHIYKCAKNNDSLVLNKCLRYLKLKETKTLKYKILHIHFDKGRYVGLTCF